MSNELAYLHDLWKREFMARVRFLEQQMTWVMGHLTENREPESPPALVAMERATKVMGMAWSIGRAIITFGPWVLVGVQAAWKWLLPYLAKLPAAP